MKVSIFPVTLVLGGLVGCGGGNGSPGGLGTTTGGNNSSATQTYLPYETVSSSSSTRSVMGGAANIISGATVAINATPISGDRNHFSGANRVTAPVFSDVVKLATDLPVDYDFVREVDVTVGAETYTGVFGVLTSATDVSSAANATYRGEFEGALISGLTLDTLSDWQATVSVDFAQGDLDAGFVGGGSLVIDEITITGAQITGNRFSGGVLSTLNNGTAVDVTGTSVQHHGAFFGYDAQVGGPDELGGVISSEAGVRQLFGSFIAD